MVLSPRPAGQCRATLMSPKTRIPKLMAHRDVIYEYIKTHDRVEFQEISVATGIDPMECMAALRWMSQDGIISKTKRRERTNHYAMWSVVKDIDEHKKDIIRMESDRNQEIQAEIDLVMGIIGSHETIDRKRLDELSGISKIRVTCVLKYLKENGLAYRKYGIEYDGNNSLGKQITRWSLKPFEDGPKCKTNSDLIITKQDLEWHHYWSQPKHIRRTLPEPKIDE